MRENKLYQKYMGNPAYVEVERYVVGQAMYAANNGQTSAQVSVREICDRYDIYDARVIYEHMTNVRCRYGYIVKSVPGLAPYVWDVSWKVG